MTTSTTTVNATRPQKWPKATTPQKWPKATTPQWQPERLVGSNEAYRVQCSYARGRFNVYSLTSGACVRFDCTRRQAERYCRFDRFDQEGE